MPKVDPKLVGKMLESGKNYVEEECMVAVVHDSGLIGVGSMTKNRRWSATLYETDVVRKHALELIALCDAVDAGPGHGAAADEEE